VADPPRLRAAAHALCALALAVPLWLAGITIARAVAFASYPYALDREEGFVALQGLALATGTTIYPDIAQGPPWLVGNYPPLHPALAAVAVKAGADPLAAGRGVALLGIVLLAGGLAWAGAQMGGRWAAVAAPVLCLSTWDAMSWAPYARVDFLALGLGAVALAAGLDRTRKGMAALCGVCVMAAFLAKQTALAVPAALVIAGLLRPEDRREALRFGAVLMAAGGAAVLALVLLTGGEFWRHTVTYNRNAVEGAQILVWLRHLARFHGGVLAALGVAGVAAWRWRLLEATHARVLACYVGLAAATLLATAKAGAAENYLLEFHAASSLAIAAVAAKALREMPAVAIAIAVPLLATLPGPFPAWRRPQMMTRELWPDAAIEEAHAAAVLRLRAAKGPVLCEDPVLAHRAGHPVAFQPFIMSQLAREGRWDAAPLLHEIAISRYGLIATSQNLAEEGFLWGFTPEMREAVLARYRLTGAVQLSPRERMFLYEPKP
jgi:hypothetical protein